MTDRYIIVLMIAFRHLLLFKYVFTFYSPIYFHYFYNYYSNYLIQMYQNYKLFINHIIICGSKG